MKILCISIGTRGDIEPFAALAEMLGEYGHEVICAFPEQFSKYARETKSGFYPLKKEFLEMLDSAAGKQTLGGGGSLFHRIKSFYGLYRQNRVVSFELLKQQKELIEREQPDLILHSLKAFYPIYWHLTHPGQVILVSPIPCVIHPVREMSSIFLNGKNYGESINRWSYGFMRRLSMGYFRGQLKKLGITDVRKNDLDKCFLEEKLMYTISGSLYPERDNWPDQVKVVGYLERDKIMHWQPHSELEEFVNRNPNPLFVTFGSMTNPDPEGKTFFLLEVLRESGIPAIVNTAAGGLAEPEDYDRRMVHFVSDIPYDWIFPRVRAVIHHGGAGTTHLALKYGCASMIIPHIPDQHLWNRIVSQHGAGPRGPRISKFVAEETRQKIKDLYRNDVYLHAAEKLGEKLRGESHTQEILKLIRKNH